MNLNSERSILTDVKAVKPNLKTINEIKSKDLQKATRILKPITDSAPAIDIIKILNVCPIPSSKLNELIKTNNVTDNNMISIAMIIKIIFFLFKINPNTPIKNKNNDRFIIISFCICIFPLGKTVNNGNVFI